MNKVIYRSLFRAQLISLILWLHDLQAAEEENARRIARETLLARIRKKKIPRYATAPPRAAVWRMATL